MIRVKTAPEMNLIARSKDLNSPEVLEKLKIEGIEKFNPDNPDLPENVRARLDIGAFYDRTTNKIFVNENLEDDAEIRASIAREWKIAEDLNAQKGKANEDGQLKSTVAGELAYDDMMKRSREGKTGSISTDELKEAVMDADSEVTSDNTTVILERSNITKDLIKEANESEVRLKNNKYILGDEKFLKDLSKFSGKSPYLYTVMTPYFGFYYLPKNIQKNYMKIDEDGDIGLRVDEFDPKGFEELQNSKEYTIAMYKTNIEVFKSVKKDIKRNGLQSNTITNDNVSQNFVEQYKILGIIPDKNGIMKAILMPEKLDITYRNAKIKSKTEIKVSESKNNDRIEVVLTREHKLYDEFSKPYDLKNGFPDSRELGNPYKLLTNYKSDKVFEGSYKKKGNSEAEIKKRLESEVIDSLDKRINEAEIKIRG